MDDLENVEQQPIYFRMAEDLSYLWYLTGLHLRMIRRAQMRLASDYPDRLSENDERLMTKHLREMQKIRRLVRDGLN